MKIYEVVDNDSMITERLFSTLEKAIKYSESEQPRNLLVYHTEVDSNKGMDWKIVYRNSDNCQYEA
jgi:hypothetical protein